MRIFLSYPSEHAALAERLALALEAENHEVFFDRHDLDAGAAFHGRLRAGIARAEAMVFLVAPESVARGSYTLTELELARQRWPKPSGRVLPVMVAPTPIEALPPYLSTVTLLEPRGEPIAETVAAVARLDDGTALPWRRLAIAGAALLAVGAGAVIVVQRQQEARAAAQAQAEAEARLVAQAGAARELCFGGGHAVALGQLDALAALPAAPERVLDQREDCAMFWLRDMRAVSGRTSFGEQVAKAQPVLLQGLARTPAGPRAADLRAHLGWGEYLRGRDGTPGVDPAKHWKRALAEDAENVYAHAMWGRQLLDRSSGLDEAREHFTRAVASGRSRTYVRNLQLGGTLGGRDELQAYALTVADEMRRGREALSDTHRARLWSHLFSVRLLDDDFRARLFAALPPADLLLTFQWLFPPASVPDERRPAWRYALATIQAEAGERAAARSGLAALVRELRAGGSTGRLLEASERALARLS